MAVSIALSIYALLLFVLAIVPATQDNLDREQRSSSLLETLRSFVAAFCVVMVIIPDAADELASLLLLPVALSVCAEVRSFCVELRNWRRLSVQDRDSIAVILLAHSLPLPAFCIGIALGLGQLFG